MNGSISTTAGVRFASLLILLSLAACRQKGTKELDRSQFAHVVSHDSAEYDAAPRLTLTGTRPACRSSDGYCRIADPPIGAVGPSDRAILYEPGGKLELFDSVGSYVRTIGQRGAGNGEYTTVMDVTVDNHSGAITVLDIGGLRLLHYDSSGTLTRAVPIRPFSTFTSAQVSPDGALFFRLPAGDAFGQSVDARFLSLDPSGESVHGFATVQASAVDIRGPGLHGMRPFFLPRGSWALGPDGSVTYASGTRSSIERYDSAGGGELFLETGVQPQLVTAADLEVEKQRVSLMFSPDWRDRAKPDIERAAARAAKIHPVFTAVRVLADGSVWLREGRGSAADSIRWDAFRPSGAWLGWVKLPTAARILGGRANRLLIAAYDKPHEPAAEWVFVAAPPPARESSGRDPGVN